MVNSTDDGIEEDVSADRQLLDLEKAPAMAAHATTAILECCPFPTQGGNCEIWCGTDHFPCGDAACQQGWRVIASALCRVIIVLRASHLLMQGGLRTVLW
jgi:hypothetical protein